MFSTPQWLHIPKSLTEQRHDLRKRGWRCSVFWCGSASKKAVLRSGIFCCCFLNRSNCKDFRTSFWIEVLFFLQKIDWLDSCIYLWIVKNKTKWYIFMEVNTMIQKVGVVGAGMMGAEIALCFTKAGYPTDFHLEDAVRSRHNVRIILCQTVQIFQICHASPFLPSSWKTEWGRPSLS